MVTVGMRPCAVIVDLIMPVMDGLALRKRMAADPNLTMIPLIPLTRHQGLRGVEGLAGAFLEPETSTS
jgi:CheY-like chemotaxis protein